MRDSTHFLNNVPLRIKPSSGSKISDFCGVVFSQEDIKGLQVSVDDIMAVQILYAKTYVNENFPNEILYEKLSILLFYIAAQVTMLTILHHDVDLRINDESVKISNNEVTIKLCE